MFDYIGANDKRELRFQAGRPQFEVGGREVCFRQNPGSNWAGVGLIYQMYC